MDPSEIPTAEILESMPELPRNLRDELLMALVLGVPEMAHAEFRLLAYFVSRLPRRLERADTAIIHFDTRLLCAHVGISEGYVSALKRRLHEQGWLYLAGRATIDLAPIVSRLPALQSRAANIWNELRFEAKDVDIVRKQAEEKESERLLMEQFLNDLIPV